MLNLVKYACLGKNTTLIVRFFNFSILYLFSAISMASGGNHQELLGSVTQAEILDIAEFKSQYDSYQPSEEEMQDMQQLENKHLYILFGSWCHDSEREVPRLLKLLDESNVQLSELTIIAVDQNKQETSGIAKALDLRFTPTFVVMDNQHEVARIIEKPNKTLAKDFAEQLASVD